MIRKSPMKKSPIQKLSPYANKLVNAASSAVQHGTQLSNAVVHKANAKAGESFDKILRSPPSDDNDKKLLKSPLRRKEPRSSGVRDRIQQFDSASKSTCNVAISGRPISSQSPYRRGGNRRYQTSPGMMNSVRRKEDGSSSNRDGEDDIDRAARDESKANGSDIIMPIPEKENELNSTQKLPPARKAKKKKKVDKRHEQQYEVESNAGSKVITSGDRMKSSTTGKEENFDKGDDRKKNMVSEEDILNNDIDQHSQSAFLDGKSGRGNINQRQKKSNHHHHHHHHSKPSNDNNSNMTIEQLNRAAVTSSSKNNVNNDHDTNTKSSTTATKRHHRNTTLLTDNNVIPKSFLDQTTRKREESPTRHELIQSPLRKHIKVVHESACSNATCTMMKEPFQLMLPSQLDQQEKERGRSSNNNNHSSDGRKHENEDDEEEGYLDTLGVVMGNNNNTLSKMTRGCKYSDDNNVDASSSTNGKKDEKEAAAALDLLSSAAFLFKTSRRNLG